MSKKKVSTMHGCVPDSSPVALLIIDVINDMEFPGGDKLFRHALPAARKILKLKEQARKYGVPSIYVNDNFGRWRSDFHMQIDRCLAEDVRGSEVARLLVPREDDYFVLKPKHSAFHCTTLEVLLKHLGAHTLILTGFAGNICVAYSANDAHMRDFKVHVPADCVASEQAKDNAAALSQMRRFMGADTRPSTTAGYLRSLI